MVKKILIKSFVLTRGIEFLLYSWLHVNHMKHSCWEIWLFGTFSDYFIWQESVTCFLLYPHSLSATLPTTMNNHILALDFMDSWILPHSHLWSVNTLQPLSPKCSINHIHSLLVPVIPILSWERYGIWKSTIQYF